MLDHIALTVADHDRSRRFYQSVLAALGYELVMEHEISGAGFGSSSMYTKALPNCRIHSASLVQTKHVLLSHKNDCSPNSECLRGFDDVYTPGANVAPYGRLLLRSLEYFCWY